MVTSPTSSGMKTPLKERVKGCSFTWGWSSVLVSMGQSHVETPTSVAVVRGLGIHDIGLTGQGRPGKKQGHKKRER